MKGHLAGVRLAVGREYLDITSSRHCGEFAYETTLTYSRRSEKTYDRAVALNCAPEQFLDGEHFPPPADQFRLNTSDRTMLCVHAQQSLGRDRFVGTVDPDQLGLAENRCGMNQSGGRRTEQHFTGRSSSLHSLSHPDVLTDSGVGKGPRADVTGDHLTGVQPNANLKINAIELSDVDADLLDVFLNAQRRQTGTHSVVLQSDRRTEHRHDPATGDSVDRAAEVLHHRRAAVDKFNHDFAQALSADAGGNVHR